MSRQEKLAALASTGITKAELDNIDGGTARGTTAIADGDGVLINDAGTMRMTSVETMATYMGTKIGGGMEFIASSGAISDAANVSFTGFDSSKYDSYEFRFIDFLPATDGSYPVARTSSDTSSHSYDSGASDYQLQLSGTTADSLGRLNSNNQIGNAANEGFVAIVRVINPHTSTFTKVSVNDGVYVNTTAGYASISGQGGFARKENAQVNAIQFFYNSGNIASGEVIMFGIVNS
jgi:hypothetical protein